VLVARRASLLDELAGEIAAAGGQRPTCVAADLVDPATPLQVAEATAQLGGAAILINNAGGSRPLPVLAGDDLWDEAMALNFTSVRRLTQALLPQMQQRRWGRIVNITGSLEPRAVNGANAAKGAVHVWAKGLACDVASDGITVNCIGPGRIHSEQIDQRLHPTAASREAFIAAHIPIGHFGVPEDVAWTVAFLGSERARYVTGQSFYIDGGMHRSI